MSDSEIRRRPGGRAARVRKAVLDAAVESLVEGGTARFAIGDIARRAGVNETSVYRRWRTRENLLVDAMLAASDRHVPVPDTGSVREDLRAFAAVVADYLNDPLGSALARAAVVAVDDPEIAEARERFWHTRIDLAAVMIERGIARGEVRPGTDPRVALEALISPLHSRVLMTREPLGEELPRALADLVSDGLSPTRRPPAGTSAR